jgi:hypothetical protein
MSVEVLTPGDCQPKADCSLLHREVLFLQLENMESKNKLESALVSVTMFLLFAGARTFYNQSRLRSQVGYSPSTGQERLILLMKLEFSPSNSALSID